MPIGELGPKDAHAARSADASIVLVDVRTTAEFEAGHPAGALNVPFMEGAPGMFTPNPDFVKVMSAVVPKETRLLLSCLSGQRSMRAAMALEQNGWRDLANVRCGFGGAKNMFGQITEPGWAASGLPVDDGSPAERSYGALRKRAGLR